jgi:hypothetical protein
MRYFRVHPVENYCDKALVQYYSYFGLVFMEPDGSVLWSHPDLQQYDI